MPRTRVVVLVWGVLTPVFAPSLAGSPANAQVRTPLDGFDLVRVHPEIQYPETVPSPVEIEWQTLPDKPLALKGGVAGVLNNHLVVVPGIGDRSYDAVVQALDLTSLTWSDLPPIPKPPVYTTGVTARDSIVMLSGRGDSTPKVGASVQRLRFVGGNWVWDELPPLPRQIWYASSACVDDRWIVVCNGATADGMAPWQASRDVWVLDLDHLSTGWQTAAEYEHGVLQPMLAGLNGKVYIFGGAIYYPDLRAEYEYLASKGMGPWHNGWLRQSYAYSLDLVTRQWRRCADMPFRRSGGVARQYGRYILIFGGSNGSSDHNCNRPDGWSGYNDEVFVYDTVQDTWSVLDRPVPYGTNNPQVTIDGDTVYIVGGEAGSPNTENFVVKGTMRAANWHASDYWHRELVANENTLALWHFNETGGTTANDSAGAANNACGLQGGASFAAVGVTDHGGLHPPVDFGRALSLNGSTAFGLAPDHPELEFPGITFTVEFWIKPAARSWQRILSKYTAAQRSWEIVIAHDNSLPPAERFNDGGYHLCFKLGPGLESAEVRRAAAAPLAPNQWQFVAVFFDALGLPRVFINGVESATRNVFSASIGCLTVPPLDASVPLGIGCYDAANTEGRIISYSGLIDEVRISRGNAVAPGPRPVGRISELRGLEPGTPVRLSGKVVTRSYVTAAWGPLEFYVEEVDRSAGVRVKYDERAFALGEVTEVTGIVGVSASGEVYLDATGVSSVGSADPIKPLGMAMRSLCGSPVSAGLYNQGILVRVAGRVTQVEANQESFCLDDGTGLSGGSGPVGVRVMSPLDPATLQPVAPQLNSFVAVTGVVSSYVSGSPQSGAWIEPLLRPGLLDDVEVVSETP